MEVLHQLLGVFGEYGYFAVFSVLILCGFGLPVPEDISLIAGGVICALAKNELHHINVHVMVLVGLSGVLIGDSIMFTLGNTLGPRITTIPIIRRLITIKIYTQIQDKFHRFGNKALFIARFLPGLRAPIFVTAGISHRVTIWKFLLFDGFAALISVPLWVYFGYICADDLDLLVAMARKSELLLVAVVVGVVIAAVVIKKIKQYFIK